MLVGLRSSVSVVVALVAASAMLTTPVSADEGPGSPPPPPLFATSLAAWEQSLALRLDLDSAAREAQVAPADLPAQSVREVIDVWEGSLGSCCSFYDVSTVVSPGMVKVVFSVGP